MAVGVDMAVGGLCCRRGCVAVAIAVAISGFNCRTPDTVGSGNCCRGWNCGAALATAATGVCQGCCGGTNGALGCCAVGCTTGTWSCAVGDTNGVRTCAETLCGGSASAGATCVATTGTEDSDREGVNGAADCCRRLRFAVVVAPPIWDLFIPAGVGAIAFAFVSFVKSGSMAVSTFSKALSLAACCSRISCSIFSICHEAATLRVSFYHNATPSH